jgi:hypothetical protein
LWAAISHLRQAACKYSYVVGKRNAANTQALADDLRTRVLNRPQITADGFQPYPAAIAAAFGRNDVDFTQLEKIYKGVEGNSAEASLLTGPDKRSPRDDRR